MCQGFEEATREHKPAGPFSHLLKAASEFFSSIAGGRDDVPAATAEEIEGQQAKSPGVAAEPAGDEGDDEGSVDDDIEQEVNNTFENPHDEDERETGFKLGQMVEIAKALSRGAKVIAFDAERFFAVVRRLREQRKVLLYVTHRMEEVGALCDSGTVLRDVRIRETLKRVHKELEEAVGELVLSEIG